LDAARAELSLKASAVSTHHVDASYADAVQAAADQVRREHGPAALLINSAGVALTGPFADTDPGAFDWVMRVNFDGTVRCCRAFLPQMREVGTGHIVTIGSCFGWVGFPGKAGYCASKFAVRGFSEALRLELRSSGIGVTVVYPGPVDTNLVRDGRAVDDRSRQDEVEFLARHGVAPEKVALLTIRAIERDRPRVVIGPHYRAIDLLVRLAPSGALAAMGRFAPGSPSASRPLIAARDQVE
jgi:short-subunit dehydrogenase